jgi:hypothetical protein
VAVCIIGSDEHGIDIADGVAREISRRGYLLGPADDCDLVVAVATAESRKALDDWSSDSPAPWGAALRRSVDAGVPLLILWRSGDGSPFAAEEMVDIRSDDLGTALEDSLPELKVMLIGMRGDDTFKVRSTDFGGARRQLEELDGTGQFVNLQTVVVIPTDSDTRAGESTVANLDQILDATVGRYGL